MVDAATAALCAQTVRAAFAQTVAELEQLPIADRDLAKREDLAGRPHLTFVRFDQLGYPMGDSLIPLIDLAGGSEEPSGEPTGITRFDELMDETTADLHDRLLNLSAPFASEISVDFDNAVLNRVYEDVLRSAQFAGRLSSEEAAVKTARDFLFPEDATGMRVRSDALKLYEDYETRFGQLQLAVESARNAGDATGVETLETQATRLRAEWGTLGRKLDVETAFETLATADADAGFGDERNRFLEILESRKRHRISSALSYAAVTIQPLSALIDAEDDLHWTTISLDGDKIRNTLNGDTLALFGLTHDIVEPALDVLKSAQMKYSVVGLHREWLQRDFLEARYWRHAEKILSDGQGGGLAPTVASSAIFVREATFEVGELIASEGTAGQPKVTQQVRRMHQATSTPLITMMTARTGTTANAGAALISKLPAAQARQLTAVLDARALDHRHRAKVPSTLGQASGRPMPTESPPPNRPALLRGARLKNEVVRAARGRAAKLGAAVPRPRPRTGPLLRNRTGPPRSRRRGAGLWIDGHITIADGVARNDFVLTLILQTPSGEPKSRELTLREDGANSFVFRQLVRRDDETRDRITAATLRLERPDGRVLIEKAFEIASRSSLSNVAWSVESATATFEVTGRTDPTLMAYGLEILPRCPNPDEDLVWE